MLPKKISFVDIETTGTSLYRDRIIEVAILRVENNILVNTYQTLINPQTYIPAEIESITGIKANDLIKAPLFEDIKNNILEILEDSVFVAHNVRFDYGFLKNEFKRIETKFSPKHFCTVKLSRYLYPTHRHHNLDSIIERFNISCTNRHRAFDDAKVLFDFFTHVQTQFPLETIEKAVGKALKKPSIPAKLTNQDLKNLPNTPGVYIFYGENNIPLYVGKSINLKERVLSHFTNDHATSSDMKISQQVESIKTIQTAGELGALFAEANLIKTLQPIYNRVLRRSRKLIVCIEKENKLGYKTIEMQEKDTILSSEIDKILLVTKSKKQAKNILIELAKSKGLCEKLLGVEHADAACFGYRLSRCRGACINKEKSLVYNMRFIMAFSQYKIKQWPFSGAIQIVESDVDNDKTELFLIDNWCYLGSITSESELVETQISSNYTFDVDNYKILKRYITSAKNTKRINSVSKKDSSILPENNSSFTYDAF